LKDASATALYGSRGANGVIIVTTKKGAEGPTKVNFSASYGIQEIANSIEVMNSVDFLRLNRDAYENAGELWPGEPSQGDTLVNTNWQDEFFKLGKIQDYNLSVSGGNANANYLVSGNVYKQDGVVKGPTHDRYTFRVNTSMNKGIFTFGENFNFGRSETTTLIGSPFIDLCRMPPVIPVYDEENESGYGYGSSSYSTYATNPIGAQKTRTNTQASNRIMGNVYGELDFLKYFKYRLNLGLEYHNWHDRNINTLDQLRYLQAEKYENYFSETRGDFSTYIVENLLTYKQKVGKHAFDALLGYTSEVTNWKQMSAGVYNVEEPYWVLNSGVTEANVGGSDSETALASLLGRVNYNYNEKYLFQFNVRNDGSSRFGTNYRYGTYPSASVGWRINKEPFMQWSDSYVDNLKFRASYGKVGNQASIPSYAYTTYMNIEGSVSGTSQQFQQGWIQKGQANPDLRWEEKTTFNIGLDFSLLNSSVYGSVEYYNSKSKDLLVQIPVSWTEGTDETPWTNYGAIDNTGFEASLGYRKQSGDFKYSVAMNMALPRTEVVKLEDSFREAGINNVNRSEVGRSIGDFYVIQTDGIFQNVDEIYAHTSQVVDAETGLVSTLVIQPNAAPGDLRYKDENNDGMISNDDRVYMGSPLPTFEGGLNFSASYKDFDLSLFFYGVYGNQIFNNTKFWLERMDETSNYPAGLHPWTEANPSTTTPRAYIGPNDNAKANTDRWIEDGSYLRLKNLQVGYTIPFEKMPNKAQVLENCRVYFSAENLFTLTNYSGFDPEISGGSAFAKGN
ncbi:MAG: SusC/RagA family TonB-linked outer membrane protein, partial [Bacteroidales bacterium]|nr:SusC/RagA family TonB-linked outer membrane protein [Bacteroidales bacterium]